jgi:hypothetical protein
MTRDDDFRKLPPGGNVLDDVAQAGQDLRDRNILPDVVGPDQQKHHVGILRRVQPLGKNGEESVGSRARPPLIITMTHAMTRR